MGIRMNTIEEITRNRREKERLAKDGPLDWQPTKLYEAVCRGDEEQVFNLFIGVNAVDGNRVGVDDRTPSGDTPLFEAARRDYSGIINILVDHGADVNALNYFGDSALHFAANRHNFKATEALIDKGADVSIANKLGRTPLNWVLHDFRPTEEADWKDMENITALLVRAGADTNIGAGLKSTPFMVLAHMYSEPHLHEEEPIGDPDYALLSLMIKYGADINATGFEHRTALHTAVLVGDLALMLFLVQRGADWNIPDHHGQTLFETLVSPIPGTDWKTKDSMVQHQRRKYSEFHVFILALLEDIKQAMIDIPREQAFMMMKASRTHKNPLQRLPREMFHHIHGNPSEDPTPRDRCVRYTALYRIKSLKK